MNIIYKIHVILIVFCRTKRLACSSSDRLHL